jgi:hypothetical protein
LIPYDRIMVSLSSPVGPRLRPTKIRSRLVLLILATLIPILAFSGFMLVAFNRQTRSATERGLIETARALSVAVDQHVSASMSVLQALATSAHLQNGDLEEFDRTAHAVLASQPAWHSVVLFTPEGRQLLNTRLPFGALLPITGNPEMVAQVARTQRPIVSDVFQGQPPKSTARHAGRGAGCSKWCGRIRPGRGLRPQCADGHSPRAASPAGHRRNPSRSQQGDHRPDARGGSLRRSVGHR